MADIYDRIILRFSDTLLDQFGENGLGTDRVLGLSGDVEVKKMLWSSTDGQKMNC